MQQWHTQPPVQNQPAALEQRADFARFSDTDRVYQLANAAELDRLGEFIDELELSNYVPKRPYDELRKMMHDPPIFATHVQLFVMTAKLSELKFVGMGKKDSAQRDPFFPISGSTTLIIDNEPCSIVPSYFPQLSYGIESYIDGPYSRAYHRCCKLERNHPGCWYGPEKYKITPWIITAQNFADLNTKDQIISGLRVPIARGTYWLKDPIDQVTALRKSLENEIVGAILYGKELSLDYFTLLELTYNVDFVEEAADRAHRPPPPSSPPLPPLPLDDTEPLDPDVGTPSQLYLAVIARRDDYALLNADIEELVEAYNDYLITDKMKQALRYTDELLEVPTVIPSEERLLLLQQMLAPGYFDRLQVLKDCIDTPIDGSVARLLYQATIINDVATIDLIKLRARVFAASAKLGILPPMMTRPNIDVAFDAFVNANKGSIPIPPGIPVPAPGSTDEFELAFEYFSTGKIDAERFIPREVALSPYGKKAPVDANVFFKGIQFKWDQDSCWFDSVFTALFSMPNSPWEIEIRNATKMYVRQGCDGNAFRDAIMRDVEYLHGESREFDESASRDSSNSPSSSISFFSKCTQRPQLLNKEEYAEDTFTNLKSLFQLSDSILLRNTTDQEPNYTTFAVIVSRPGHFVPYILQPDGRWVRLDDIADKSERVLYFDHVVEGPLILKNKDIPGETYEFNEKINFYLDMRTDLWKQMTKLTAKDVFLHWKNIRNRLNLLQPIFLNDEQKRIKANSTTAKSIPSHNKLLYDDPDTFVDVVTSIMDDTFDYSLYPDGVNDLSFPEPVDYTAHLKDLISVFGVVRKNLARGKIFSDPHDDTSYYQLLKLAIKPRFVSTVLYGNKVPRLVATDSEQSYVSEDEAEMQTILAYFFNEREPSIKGKVMEI